MRILKKEKNIFSPCFANKRQTKIEKIPLKIFALLGKYLASTKNHWGKEVNILRLLEQKKNNGK